MRLSNELSCEAGSFSCCCNSHRVLQPEVVRLSLSALAPWVEQSVSSPVVLPSLPAWECGISCSACCLVTSPVHPGFPSLPLLPVWMNVSLTPYSEVLRLPYSLIFWQFWLFSSFKSFVILLLVVQGSKACLPMPSSWLET